MRRGGSTDRRANDRRHCRDQRRYEECAHATPGIFSEIAQLAAPAAARQRKTSRLSGIDVGQARAEQKSERPGSSRLDSDQGQYATAPVLGSARGAEINDEQ
jgi:hypothetical protein